MCTASGLPAQQIIQTYGEPGQTSQVLGSIEATGELLENSRPVANPDLAEEGWRWIEIVEPRTVFVRDADIGKELIPVQSALMYAEPNENSAVVTTFDEADPIEIVDSGSWWELRIFKALPVYFLDPSLPAATASSQDSRVNEAVALVPLQSDPGPLESAPAPAIETTPALDDPVQAYSSAPRETPGPQNFGAGSTGLAQNFDGTFVRIKPKLLFIQPKHPYALRDESGRRVVWVDVSKILVPQTVDNFVNKPVVIYGRKRFDPDIDDWFVEALNMRLK